MTAEEYKAEVAAKAEAIAKVRATPNPAIAHMRIGPPVCPRCGDGLMFARQAAFPGEMVPVLHFALDNHCAWYGVAPTSIPIPVKETADDVA